MKKLLTSVSFSHLSIVEDEKANAEQTEVLLSAMRWNCCSSRPIFHKTAFKECGTGDTSCENFRERAADLDALEP